MILLEKNVKGKTFRVVKHSIIEEKVDAIVNPANENLAHGGGVAGVISRAGGPKIQKESDAKAPIKTGDATFTSAGSLPHKYVIHTVGPIYRGGMNGEDKLLESAVKSALKIADDLKIKSVSLPSISTGIFGYPLEPAIIIIADTILKYLENETQLQEIRLCENSGTKAEEIKKIIEQHI